MTVAFDAATVQALTYGGFSFTHTPVGTPRAVVVMIEQKGGASDTVTGVTYGGVAMTRAATFKSFTAGLVMGATYMYFLGASIPTGAQTVTVSQSSSDWRTAFCLTYTAAADCQAIDAESYSGTGTTTPTGTTLSLTGLTSAVVMGFMSDCLQTGRVTPFTGWTSSNETDHGSEISGYYRYNTIASADVTWGCTLSLSTYYIAMSAIAITEIPPADTFIPQINFI